MPAKAKTKTTGGDAPQRARPITIASVVTIKRCR